MGDSYQSLVPKEYASFTILEYLSKKFSYHSAEDWEFLVMGDRLSVNGNIVSKDFVLKTGDSIVYRPILGRISEPTVDKEFEILKETEDFLFISKPGNLPVHPAGRYRTQTLLSFLEIKYQKLFPVHRLDRETSGVIIFAKNETARASLQKKFESREVEKKYLAIVRGKFTERISLSGFIGRDANSVIRKKQIFRMKEFENSKTSISKFYPLVWNQNLDLSLVGIRLETGRIHQIRANCLFLGHPILGDKMYGDRESIFLDFINQGESESLLNELGHFRQALHSYSISYFDDSIGETISVVCPLHHDLSIYFPDYKDYVPSF
ncbi:RluA family pseudouridine synthase [Leptospira sp. 96542]|nr:RluA family pseudouridine synthase [Leptospira sp. 96542]